MSTSPAPLAAKGAKEPRKKCYSWEADLFQIAAKRLACPGYGLNYRWADVRRSQAKHRSGPGLQSRKSLPNDTSESANIIPSLEGPRARKESSTSPDETFLQNQNLLVSYYATNIAPTMVWLESDQNEYRQMIIPLSNTQLGLRSAIIAIAAAHAGENLIATDAISRDAYREALQTITARVRNMIEKDSAERFTQSFEETCDTDEAILAAALILKNHSLLYSELSSAQIHRQAVRILIKSISFKQLTDQALFGFLRNQAAIHDVLSCTTLFDDDYLVEAVVPDLTYKNALFSRFLAIIHDITIISVGRQCGNIFTSPVTIDELEDQFELARASTLAAAANFTFYREPASADFVRLAQLYHHAGILYALKRLEIENCSLAEDYHTLRLFRTLENFDHLQSMLLNLPWPVFVAGICSWPNIERMRAVSRLSSLIAETTRFRHYANISSFHQELWDSPHHNWLLLAKLWESKQISVVPV